VVGVVDPGADVTVDEGAVVDEEVVVVVVGAGTVTRDPKNGVVVLVTGPKTKAVVVVLAKRRAESSPPLMVETGASGMVPSASGTWAASTSGAPEPTRSRSQLTPATTAKTRVPAARTTIAIDMRRPTRTLSRREKPTFFGAFDSARRCAI